MKLRPATIHDCDLLLQWRNDPQTRDASHDANIVSESEHRAWLEDALKTPNRHLYIAEIDEVPVGSSRADLENGCFELSWTVAPESRGRGVAKQMVELLAKQFADPIRAEVKAGNLASVRIAESVGMTIEKEVDGVLHFRRDQAT